MKRSLRNKASTEQSTPYSEAEAERYVDLAQYEAMMSAAGRRARNPALARKRVEQSHSKGQAMLVIALMMTVLILFVGLGVDVGNLMGKRASYRALWTLRPFLLHRSCRMAVSSAPPYLQKPTKCCKQTECPQAPLAQVT